MTENSKPTFYADTTSLITTNKQMGVACATFYPIARTPTAPTTSTMTNMTAITKIFVIH
jgi:hypothetical protein